MYQICAREEPSAGGIIFIEPISKFNFAPICHFRPHLHEGKHQPRGRGVNGNLTIWVIPTGDRYLQIRHPGLPRIRFWTWRQNDGSGSGFRLPPLPGYGGQAEAGMIEKIF